jgi:hypothetical protein
MKKLVLAAAGLFMVLLISVSATAQNRNKCGTMEYHHWLMQTNPAYAQSYANNERAIQQWIAAHPNFNQKTAMLPPDTIPVVVHVVWKTAIQNISDQQILSQIDVLNEDFGRANADTVNTPVPWQSIAGSMPYRFHLARQDPSGNATNGIVRVQTTVNSFTTNNAIKFDAQGGSNSWDVTTYLNIWVGNLGGGLLGYGEFPTGTASNTYGFVCIYNSFGRVGTVVAPYNLGRTTTHELSHCFQLYHIWGDDGGACSGSDGIADTPNQADATFGCFTWPHNDACNATANGIMFENYMDYSDDDCMNLFTEEQTAHMVTALNTFYPTIINSIGLQPPSSLANDAGVPAIVSPFTGSCTSFDPIVTLKNWGISNLTSAIINYKLDNNLQPAFPWAGTLTPGSTVNVTLPNLSATAGLHSFTAYSTLPNGVADANTSNDTVLTSFTTIPPGVAGTVVEGFEMPAFPPAGWAVYNPDLDYTWLRSTAAFHIGTACMVKDNYNDSIWGHVDDFTYQNMDLTSINNPQITFYLAYRLYTDPSLPTNFSDTLQVLISTDCGSTYTILYNQFGVGLTTTIPTWANNSFVPNASQWRLETIDLTPYAAAQNAIVKFRNITQFENNLYIDDININSSTGINQISYDPSFTVFPIPTKGILNVQWGSVLKQDISIEITNALGQSIYNSTVKNYSGTILPINLSKNDSGIYFIKVRSKDKTVNQKIVLQK